MRATLEERFWSKVERGDPDWCWTWTGTRAVHHEGDAPSYGLLMVASETKRGFVRAHRMAYELLVGPIPPGLVIDHLCENTGCVNPKHLEPVTQRVNTLRGRSNAAVNAGKTHCVRGHPLTDSNLYPHPSGQRRCRECTKAAERDRYWRNRDPKASKPTGKRETSQGPSDASWPTEIVSTRRR